MIDVMERLEQLERQVRRQRLMLIAGGIAGAAALLTGFAAGPADLNETKAIRIIDAAGTPRILIGAPAPSDGRVRKDGQTASVVVLGPDGQDRVVLGEAPNPRLDGKSYPRVAASYGLVISDKNGSERGAVNYLDNGRGVIALDRPGGDAVSMIVNEQSGFAGFTVNYANPLGKYEEGWRIGTKGDEAWLSLQDRAQGERARLSSLGAAAPRLVSRPAGAPPAP